MSDTEEPAAKPAPKAGDRVRVVGDKTAYKSYLGTVARVRTEPYFKFPVIVKLDSAGFGEVGESNFNPDELEVIVDG